METKKKKLSKKKVIIGSVILVVVLAVGAIVGVIIHTHTRPVDTNKIYTFEEITQGLSKNIKYYISEDDENASAAPEVYYESLFTYQYVKTDDSDWGDITIKMLFYDENDNLLFSVNMFRYGAIYIKIDDKGEYYYLNFV